MDREVKIQRLLDIVERVVFVHATHDVPPEREALDELKKLIETLRQNDPARNPRASKH